MCVCSVTQLCLTLCDPMDCSLPGTSVHGILQARTGVGYHFLLQGIFPTKGLLHLLLKFMSIESVSVLSHFCRVRLILTHVL